MIGDFFKASESGRKTIIEEAQTKADALTDESEKTSANSYVKTMEKIVEKGDDFVKSELDRVEKLSEGKVSAKKKGQLKDRASILTSFQMHMTPEKEEL